MFDNLRNDASFFNDGSEPVFEQPGRAPAKKKRRPGKFLGMTPVQRFIIAMMFMIAVCVLGAMVLLVTGKFWLA
ncbi:MAG: hypothetical protein ACOYYU_20220 [Chloroflexota bacterium]